VRLVTPWLVHTSVLSVPNFTIHSYNHRFHSRYKGYHICQGGLIRFDIVLILCSSYASYPSLIYN
jgi:hypothetical protein